MRVFVTGAAGRLGRRLVRRFANDHEVVGFDVAEPPEDWPAGVGYTQGDLRDAEKVREAAGGAEIVIHLAAIPGRANHMPQAELFAVNVQGTFHVLEAAERGGARMVVLASSLCAIGLPDALDQHGLIYLPVDEDHPCRPRHTYDLSKRINEVHAETFTRLTGVATVCLRFPLLADVRNDAWFAEHLRREPMRLPLGDYLDHQDAIAAVERAMASHELTHQVLLLHAATAGFPHSTPEHLKRFEPPVVWRGQEPPGETTPLIDCGRAKRVLRWSPKIIWQEGTAELPA